MKLHFHKLTAWAPGINTDDDWLAWAGGELFFAESSKPSVADVPALTRRRLTFWGKMALEVACKASINLENTCPCVLSSRHGDTVRTYELLESIANGEALSPTAFSLSVHNSALGVFSIVKNMVAGATAIAAGRDTLAQAMLEAWCLLSSGATRVLLIHVDNHLAEFYRPDADEQEHPHAFAAVLSLTGDAATAISIQSSVQEERESHVPQAESLGLQFLRFFYSESSLFHYAGSRLRWSFERPADQRAA